MVQWPELYGSKLRNGIPQSSISGPLWFLIENLVSVAKTFADDTSLFSLVFDQLQSASDLNRDLRKICEWAYQWKM